MSKKSLELIEECFNCLFKFVETGFIVVEEQVKSIIDSLSQSISDNFIETICLSLAKAIRADFVFVAKIDDDKEIATTLSVASQYKTLDNFSYALKTSPCENAYKGELCTHLTNCQITYPNYNLLVNS